MTKDTGGPAFMVAELANVQHEGMSLRDYFAAKAMQGLLAGTKTSNGAMIVKDSYAIADAMLKAREL